MITLISIIGILVTIITGFIIGKSRNRTSTKTIKKVGDSIIGKEEESREKITKIRAGEKIKYMFRKKKGNKGKFKRG